MDDKNPRFAAIHLEVLLHYYYSPEQWRLCRHVTPASDEAHRRLESMELLEPKRDDDRHVGYVITGRGQVYVKGLLQVPLPEKRWVMG